ARLGGVAAQRESVEGPGQAAPDLTEEGIVPVDRVGLGRSVGTQVAVARAQRAGVDAARVDGGHAVQVELGAGGRVARRRSPAGLEVDQLGPPVALVDGVDTTTDHAAADDYDEGGLDPHGVEVGVRAVQERLLQCPPYVHTGGNGVGVEVAVG